jgi:hypothetical protein
MKPTLRKKLIELLATEEKSGHESLTAWRELAGELHAELDSLLTYAGGYHTAIVEKLGPQNIQGQRVQKHLRHVQKTLIQPWWDADKRQQKKRRPEVSIR